MSERFKPGDVVRLKSGGPNMTIVKFGSFSMGTKEGYLCKWFGAKNVLTDEVFSDAELEAVDERASRATSGAAERGVSGPHGWMAN